MYISQKYNIPPETVSAMVRDGILDWRVDALYDFWVFYLELCNSGRTRKEIKNEVGLHFKMKKYQVNRSIRKAKEIFGTGNCTILGNFK